MRILDTTEIAYDLTQRQRWSHYFVLLFGIVALFLGFSLRTNALTATTAYRDREAGVTAQYPKNWLVDVEGDYIFRVRDMTRASFNTTIEVRVEPVGVSSSLRSIIDAINLRRGPTLAAYRVLSQETTTLPNEKEALVMIYTFAATEANPFLESFPTVVQGTDVLTIERGQAIIITFLAGINDLQDTEPIFNRFLEDLEF